MPPCYAELHCLSNFSFQRGASHPEELVQRAAQLGYTALALTDECSLAGVVRAHLALRALPQPATLRLIVGSELHLDDATALVVLACDREGYGNLSELLSLGRGRADKGRYRLSRTDLADGLPGCLALLLAPPRLAGVELHGTQPDGCAILLEQARWLHARFGARAWLAVELHRGPDDEARLRALQDVAAQAGLPVCASGDVHMHLRSRRRLQDVLAALRCQRPLQDCGDALFPNAERHLRSLPRLAALYPPELLQESTRIAGRCHFSLDELRYEYPDEIVPPGHSAASWLRALTEDGYARRCCDIRRVLDCDPTHFATKAAELRSQIEHELSLIAALRYEPYFLTVYDIVAWARSQGILCQGRGSAANSAVCYCLGITEVDPWRANMLFERFISRERGEPPDIDVDFEHERREEVIQYLYAKYGRDRAALAATVVSYRPRSALRDVGRALGFDADSLDRLSDAHMAWDGQTIQEEALRAQGFDPASPRVRLLLELAPQLMGFPRHLSQHVGGFVIARDKLTRLVPVENARMAQRCIIQWDKDDLDALGLLKIDVLALGMLTALRRSFDALDRHAAQGGTGAHPAPYPRSLADIAPEDPATYAMLCAGDSVGVFQIESRAQMNMLPRLRPRCYYDLVIQVAIVRPGPIQGGMVHPYLQRRRLPPERIAYPSQALRPVLERTLGVPIFQEQVMQLAVVAAGFTPGQADELRRSMAAWRRRGTLERYQRQLVDGMRERGYSEAFAQQICQQIEGFSGYGFPESHAASFALLVYASSWLKCHHPAAFLCGLLNSQPMGFYAPAQLIADARRHGVQVLPADVSHSEHDSRLDGPAPAVRLGLGLIQGMTPALSARIVAARRQGPWGDVETLARHADLSPAQLRVLAAGGALASLAGHRRQAWWQAAARRPDGVMQPARLGEAALVLPAPHEAEDIVADYASLGFTLGRHPLALLRQRLRAMRFLSASELANQPDRALARTAGLVTCRQRPGTASGIVFVTLEDETGLANIIVRAELVQRQRGELLGARLLGVYGQVSREGSVVQLVAGRLVDHSALLGELHTHSRDFH